MLKSTPSLPLGTDRRQSGVRRDHSESRAWLQLRRLSNEGRFFFPRVHVEGTRSQQHHPAAKGHG